MRTPSVAPISFCKASNRSNYLCTKINHLYRKGYKTEQIAQQLKIGKSSVRYYYYGIHNCPEAHYHWKNAFDKNKEAGFIQYSLNQVRVGAAVSL